MKHLTWAATLVVVLTLAGCASSSPSLSSRCTVGPAGYETPPRSYTLDLTNGTGQPVTVQDAEVGLFGADGTQVGTASPVAGRVVAPHTTYSYDGVIYLSEVSGTVASCRLLTWTAG